jgi:hypothetical protein
VLTLGAVAIVCHFLLLKQQNHCELEVAWRDNSLECNVELPICCVYISTYDKLHLSLGSNQGIRSHTFSCCFMKKGRERRAAAFHPTHYPSIYLGAHSAISPIEAVSEGIEEAGF